MAMPTAPALALRAKPLRVLSLRASIGIALALTGCTKAPVQETEQPVEPMPPADYNAGNNVYVWADPDTGCKYLIFSPYREGGIIARLRADGAPDCPAAQPKEINP